MRNGEKEGEGREIEGKVEVRWEGEEHLKPEKSAQRDLLIWVLVFCKMPFFSQQIYLFLAHL